MRSLALDGSLLRFDRRSGKNELWSGPATANLVQRAPRVLQVAVTNVCNKQCSFCYRPLDADSAWTFDSLLELAHFCAEWGVLEIAFGGGEPTVFPRFAELLTRIWDETPLCPSFTTNGSRLTSILLETLRGKYGQIQLSIYDDDDYASTIRCLVTNKARFGLNYLVTPKRVHSIEADVQAFLRLGVREMLFLSYKGDDPQLHLRDRDLARLDQSLARLHRHLGPQMSMKVDSCWGHRLKETPQLLFAGDCGAGLAFMSIGSDKSVAACSFQNGAKRFEAPSELPELYMQLKGGKSCAGMGCARLPNYGFSKLRRAGVMP